VNLVGFAPSPENDPNVVDIVRDGKKIDTIRFTTSSTTKTYDEGNTATVVYEATWTSTGADDNTGSERATLAAPTGCTPPCEERGVFAYTFDGPAGEATFTLSGETPLCAPVTVLLASYRTEGATAQTSGHHSVFDQMSVQITKPGTYPLQVEVPGCFTEVDLYVTDKKAVDFDFPNNPLGKFLASIVLPKAGPPATFNGGTVSCAPPTTPPPPAAAPGPSLPATGASTAPKIGLAALLLTLGASLVYFGRRRRTTH